MKIKLEFNLPDEKSDFELSYQGPKFYSALSELDAYLRNFVKYESDDDETRGTHYAELRTKLHEILQENDVSLDL